MIKLSEFIQRELYNMMNIKEFNEKFNIASMEEKLDLIKDFCIELLIVLEQNNYTEQDNQLIKDFVISGTYHKIVEEYIEDSIVRRLILRIREEYRFGIGEKNEDLKNFYEENKMFDALRISLEYSIDKGIDGREVKEYIKLINDYAIKCVDIGNNNVLRRIEKIREYITPEEFQRSLVHKEVIEYFNDIEDPESKKDNFREYTTRYIDYLILQGRKIDLKKDEIFQLYSNKAIAEFRDEIARKLILREVLLTDDNQENDLEEEKEADQSAEMHKKILNMVQGISTKLRGYYENIFYNGKEEAKELDKLIDVSEFLLDILEKEKTYSEFSVQLIKAYVEKGFYAKIIELGIENSEVRDLILSIWNEYESNIWYKEKSLKNFSQDEEMDVILIESMELSIEKGLDGRSVEEYVSLINDYATRCVNTAREKSLKNIEKLREHLTIEEFQESKAHKYITEQVFESIKRRQVYRQSEYKRYIERYIEYLISNGKELDFDNDRILRLSNVLSKKYFDGHKMLREHEANKEYTIEELRCINKYMKDILEYSFEDGENVLREEEKKNISVYFRNFFDKSIENMQEIPETRELIAYLIKIEKFGLRGKDEDTKFVEAYYQGDLKRKIEAQIDMQAIQNGDIGNGIYHKMMLLINKDIDILHIFKPYLKAMGRNIDEYHSTPMKVYIEQFIEKYEHFSENDTFKESDNRIFEFIYEYIDAVTKDKEEFDLFGEQGISDILQLVYAKRIPKEQAENILNIIEENLKISEIDAKEEYKKIEEFIGNNRGKSITSKKEFDEFLKHVQNVKLANKLRIDNNVIEFIIQQNLDENSILSIKTKEYQCVIERIIEDLALNDLSPIFKKDEGRKYCYFIRDTIERERISGQHSSGHKICFKRELIKRFIENKDLGILETVFHENTHAKQLYDIDEAKYDNYLRYIMGKEEIIRQYNEEYYTANYTTMFVEIEAREEAARKVSLFLRRLNIDLNHEFIYKFLIRGNILETLESIIKKEQKKYEIGEKKVERIGDTKKQKVTDYFDRLVRDNPKIVKENPKLKMEYNEDGTLRRVNEVLEDVSKTEDNMKLILYRKILQKGNIFRKETLAEDILNLMQFECANKRTAKTVGVIISENVPRMIREALKDLEKMKLEDIKSLQDSLKRAQQCIDNEENPIFISGMSRKNTEKSGVQILQIAEKKLAKRIQQLEKKEQSKKEPLNKIGTLVNKVINNKKHKGSMQDSSDAEYRILKDAYKQSTLEERRDMMKNMIEMEHEQSEVSGYTKETNVKKESIEK